MPGPTLTTEQMTGINQMGGEHGCHRCGARSPGTLSGSYVPECHPAQVFGGASVVIPSCLACNRLAGTQVTMALYRRL